MGGERDATQPGLDKKLAVVEMLEGEDEAPTINVSDPAPQAGPAPRAGGDAAPDMAALRAEVGGLRRQAAELLAALERFEARLQG